MEPLTGTKRLAFLGFFASHIFITLFVDGQALLSPRLFPAPLKSMLAWYVETMKDPLMANASELVWFQSLVACELVFQVPFFFAACYFLWSRGSGGGGGDSGSRGVYPEWFRYWCIAYGSHTATTMVPILATLLLAVPENPDDADATTTTTTLTERISLVAVYLPYLVFPACILMLALSPSSPPSPPSSPPLSVKAKVM